MRTLALIAALAISSAAEAGAWTRGNGSYYGKIGEDFYAASEYVAPDFENVAGQSFLGRQTVLYGEWGVSKKWPVMLVAQVPLAWNTLYMAAPGEFDTRPRATTVRFADLAFSAQVGLLKDNKPLAAAFTLKVPGYANNGVGEKFGDFADLFPRLGDGQVDATAWLLGGASKGKLWTDAAIGYRFRTEAFIGWTVTDVSFADTLVLSDTTGLTLGRIILMLRIELMKSLAVDEFTRENLNAGPVVLVDLNDKGLAVEGRLAYDVWANNATKGLGGGVGLSLRK